MKYMTLNIGPTLKYDSKTQTNFFYFYFLLHSTKILFLLHFQTLQINECGPLKFFPHIQFENIHFYVPENKKKNQNQFFGQFGWFSHIGSQMLLKPHSWSVKGIALNVGHNRFDYLVIFT